MNCTWMYDWKLIDWKWLRQKTASGDGGGGPALRERQFAGPAGIGGGIVPVRRAGVAAAAATATAAAARHRYLHQSVAERRAAVHLFGWFHDIAVAWRVGQQRAAVADRLRFDGRRQTRQGLRERVQRRGQRWRRSLHLPAQEHPHVLPVPHRSFSINIYVINTLASR